MTAKLKEHLSGILLFALGIFWGDLWITELLSCPEWWFFAVNALLAGAGIWIIRKLPFEWQTTLAALLAGIILLLEPSDLRSILLPLIFGFWYGSNEELSLSWQTSRTFCGGLVIGAVLAGIYIIPYLPVILASLIMIYAGISVSWYRTIELTIFAAFYIYSALPFQNPSEPPARIDTGTVISAFALVPDNSIENEPLKIVFVGGNKADHAACERELILAGKMYIMPELPGTVPPQSSLIIVSGLPDTGDNGAAALRRALLPGGVLVMPKNFCELLPDESWHILPGSNGQYAASSPGRKLELDPVKMDDQLARHFQNVRDNAPLPGALAGMLTGFVSNELVFQLPVQKNIMRHLISGAAAMVLLFVLWIIRAKRPGTENWRIMLNCAGYTMLIALTVPVIFSGIPAFTGFNTLIAAFALMWIFRRPVTGKTPHRVIWLTGLLSLTGLCGVWFNWWSAALFCLFTGGFSFAALDGELCGKRDYEVEPVRFLGIAAGAFLAFWLQRKQIPYPAFFLTVAAMRFWSWFCS